MASEEFDIEHNLQMAFHQAMRSYAQKALKRPDDWAELRSIEEKYQARLDDLDRRHAEEFDQRVAAEVKRLVNKAGAKQYDHPAPEGIDGFDKGANIKTARRNVQLAQEADRYRIIEQMDREVFDLLDRAPVRAREARRGQAEAEFNRVNDRRSGQDRRRPGHSR